MQALKITVFKLNNLIYKKAGRLNMSENKEMVRGTFLITLSILITKILGVLFVIPFYAIMGANAEEKLAPFNYAYVPYNIAIAVANRIPLSGFKICS